MPPTPPPLALQAFYASLMRTLFFSYELHQRLGEGDDGNELSRKLRQAQSPSWLTGVRESLGRWKAAITDTLRQATNAVPKPGGPDDKVRVELGRLGMTFDKLFKRPEWSQYARGKEPDLSAAAAAQTALESALSEATVRTWRKRTGVLFCEVLRLRTLHPALNTVDDVPYLATHWKDHCASWERAERWALSLVPAKQRTPAAADGIRRKYARTMATPRFVKLTIDRLLSQVIARMPNRHEASGAWARLVREVYGDAAHLSPDAPTHPSMTGAEAAEWLNRLRHQCGRSRGLLSQMTPHFERDKRDLLAALREVIHGLEAGVFTEIIEPRLGDLRILASAVGLPQFAEISRNSFSRRDRLGNVKHLTSLRYHSPYQEVDVSTEFPLADETRASTVGVLRMWHEVIDSMKRPGWQPASGGRRGIVVSDGGAKESPPLPPDPWARLTVNLESNVITLDGRPFPVSEPAARIVNSLHQKRGGWVSGKDLQSCPDSSERPGRIIQNLPDAIRDLIKPQRGLGFSMRL